MENRKPNPNRKSSPTPGEIIAEPVLIIPTEAMRMIAKLQGLTVEEYFLELHAAHVADLKLQQLIAEKENNVCNVWRCEPREKPVDDDSPRHRCRLSPAQEREIFSMYQDSVPVSELAERYGVGATTIRRIIGEQRELENAG